MLSGVKAASQINLSITGTGGNASGSGGYNYGIRCNVDNCIQKTTSTGTLTVIGTGGNGSGGSGIYNHGVYIDDNSTYNASITG